MKWDYKVIIVMITFLFLFSFVVKAYSEQDLWILEVVVNEATSSIQTLNALVIDDKVFLPIVPVANMLRIKLDIDNENGVYTFKRPKDKVKVNINKESEEISIKEKIVKRCNKIYQINGNLYLSQDCLAKLMDADFEYNSAHLCVSIKAENLRKKN